MGYVHELVGKCDFILVPRLNCIKKNEKVCINFMTIYDLCKNTFNNVDFLNYNVDLTKRQSEKKSFIKLGKKLGINKIKIINAYNVAKKKQMEYYVNKRNGAKKILQQDCIIILIEDGIATDYAMNTLCAVGTGAFLSSQAKRLNVDVKEFGDIAIKSEEPTSIAARFTVFAESDLIHKLQMGYKKEDIIEGLCKSVALNYLNNVGKDILVDENGHLMGALGTAILALNSGIEKLFDFNIINTKFDTKATT